MGTFQLLTYTENRIAAKALNVILVRTTVVRKTQNFNTKREIELCDSFSLGCLFIHIFSQKRKY
jgi:hypothetical protein